MGGLKERIKDDMKAAMKSGEKAKLGVIRLILAALKQVEIDERIELDDAGILVVLDKMLKQRRDSITQFRGAGRLDLAENEEAEVLVIREYMPQPLSEAEIDDLVIKAIAETGATSVKDMGRVMALLKPQMQGRADMAVVSARIKGGLTI